ncbi:Abi family protein [Bombiscardovia apis]|uniref:Abi family protein n=1 Tax=Bombiscardovia apis TaxID=2932182 RepID=A0ABN6SGI5_9BIFI|nr:Abi family protein [Bombiscardovia apis]BDR54006.1 Abi family protein [Bombiscardovia apis]
MDKPFTTLSDQVRILRERGLECDEDTARVLAREGYYQVVNGYKPLFLKTNINQQDKYRDGAQFQHIYTLFCFDRDLRMLIFKYCEQAEAKLRTICSYVFTQAYPDDVYPYLEAKNYRVTADRSHLANWYKYKVEDLIDTFKHVIGLPPHRRPRFEKDYIQFYVAKHQHVPMWVLANSLSLGTMFKFFCYQSDSIRNAIAREFSRQYSFDHDDGTRFYFHDLQQKYNHIKDFRNICAHDERLYCARVDPSKGTSLAALLLDFESVLTSESAHKLKLDVFNLVQSLYGAVPDYVFDHITDSMGFPTATFAPAASSLGK